MPTLRAEWNIGDVPVYLVIDRKVDGLCGGGLRVAPDVTMGEVESLARLMTLKLAVTRIPLGGAKAAVAADSSGDRDGILKITAEALEPFLRTSYLMGEDVGTRGDDIVAIYDQIDFDVLEFVGDRLAVRGIPVDAPDDLRLADLMADDFGSSFAGDGAVHVLATAAKEVGRRLTSSRAAIQGFGSVGTAAAAALERHGVTVVAVADAHGTIYDPGGLDLETLTAARDVTGTIDRNAIGASARRLPGADWLTLPAEILVPAAVADGISAENVGAVHPSVRFVLEGANAAVTHGAERALESRGVVLLPDFVANAGAATVFGLMVTGECGFDTVLTEYLHRMDDAVKRMFAGRRDLSMRERAMEDARRWLGEIG